MTDNDGWSLDHFLHQSAGTVPLRRANTLGQTRIPEGLILPPAWLPTSTGVDITGRVHIEPNNLNILFDGGL
jgi:hypothetical protein